MTKSTGPACGNNPNHQLSDGDRRVLEDFKGRLAAQAVVAETLYGFTPLPEIPWEEAPESDRVRFRRRAAAVLAVLPTTTDQTAELTAEEARSLADDLGLQLYRAQDALAFVAECCTIAERDQRSITTADVREWLKGAQCGRQLVAGDAGLARVEGRLADGPVRCPLCPAPLNLHTPAGARAHFTTVHPEQRITGRGNGPWPLLVADETQPAETEQHRPVALATPCANLPADCTHPYNWHAGRGDCQAADCPCRRFVPGERPEPVDPRSVLGVDPEFAAGARQDGAQPS
ncbi:hypothetical protein [Streptomyces parvulus]|uniref:hypothetical protein n=1 Tax=Streptomyces parvulus TaxID=146923 RepID=UPI003702D94A